MQQEPDFVHHRLSLLGGGGHRDPSGKHRAEGAGLGSRGWVIIQQLMELSMAGCPAVVWLSGEGWLHRLGPWSRSRWGLSEVWERQESMLRPSLCAHDCAHLSAPQ